MAIIEGSTMMRGCAIAVFRDPRCDRVPPHAHHQAAELFFVLRGQVIFHLNDRSICSGGGDFVVVPSATLHDLENPGPGRLYLLTMLSKDEGFADALMQGILGR